MFFTDLETERLLLKNIDIDDREFIFNQFTNDVVNRYLFDAEPLTDINEAEEIIAFYMQPEPRAQHRWIILRKFDNVKMGTCGFHNWYPEKGAVEIGYDLKEDFWGCGYAVEAISQIIDFAKINMKIKEISAWIYVENDSSKKLVEKLGFTLTGTGKELFRNREYLHNIYVKELKEEF